MPEDPDEVREAFLEEVDRYLAEVRGALGAVRGALHPAPTDQAMDQLLALLRGFER